MKSADRFSLMDALSANVFHGAVLTSCTFDPHFFEDFCLEKFPSLVNNENISVIVDRRTYDSLVNAPDVQQPKVANIRYLLHPVSVPGRFHPKIFFFSTKTAGRLVFGSCNLSRAGLTTNAEVADKYEFELGKNETFRQLLFDAFAFLRKLADCYPSETLTSNLRQLYSSSIWLHDIPSGGDIRENEPRFIHNLEYPLWSQLRDLIIGPIDHIHIVSRFFDDQPNLLDRLIQDWNPRKVSIYTQNGITTMSRSWLKHQHVISGKAEILFCTYEDDGYQQPLHAKVLVFESGQMRRVAFGSANFTSAALLCSRKEGNIETLIVLPTIHRNAFDSKRFCDPCDTGHLLSSAEALQTAVREPPEPMVAGLIQLNEVILEHDKLLIKAKFPDDFPTSAAVVHLRVTDKTSYVLRLNRETSNQCFSRLADNLLPILEQKSTVAWLKDQNTDQQLSNALFLTNLLDIQTHESIRKGRHIREAKESASQFFAVLNELLRDGDTNALLTFLNFCDIPILNAPGYTAFRQRPVWDGSDGMRSLGERNLHICKTLHEATINFFDRHFKKLERHAKARLLEGIPNFLHIFLSMGNLIRTQMERTVLALEAKLTPLSVEDWAVYRDLWDIYFARFRVLMEFLWNNYLKHLSVQYKQSEIQREFGPDLESIHELCDEMLQIRQRIQTLKESRNVKYGYFGCVMGPKRWVPFGKGIQEIQKQVEFGVLGQNTHHLPTLSA